MDRLELQNRMQDVFREVFDNDEILLSDNISAEDIEEWDSLGHIQLIKAIEKEFGIRLTAREMRSWDNVGEMLDGLLSKF